MTLSSGIMVKISVQIYRDGDFAAWNDFLAHSANATFLFHRDFMDYHRDRFDDYSLMIYNGEKLVALLPANRDTEGVHSHQGLTYGGLVVLKGLRSHQIFSIFSEILKFLYQQGIFCFFLKELPYFYTPYPDGELKYLAYVCEAELYRRDMCSVVPLSVPRPAPKYNLQRTLKHCVKKGFHYSESIDYHNFWRDILEPELMLRHHSRPVHSLEEITLLAEKFPANIRLYAVYHGEMMMGGCVIFINEKVAHCQYIAVSSDFKKSEALYFLFFQLINNEFSKFHYFDFGISNEQEGRKTNHGLLFWKEKFGARGVTQDFYKFETAKYKNIESLYL